MKKAYIFLIALVMILALTSCDLLFVGYLDDYNESLEYTCADRGGHNFTVQEEPISCDSVRVNEVCSFCSETRTYTKSVAANHSYLGGVCTQCGEYLPDTSGLEFTLDGDAYVVSGIGSAKDQSIRIPALYNGLPVVGIADSAFKSTSFIRHVEIPEGVTSIGESAFYMCKSLETVDIPDTVSKIGEDAFTSCTSLKSIDLPESLTAIAENTFYKCDKLSSMTIPESVTSIGMLAFAYCSSLESIAIPDGVTTINYGTFADCYALTSVSIPKSVIEIDKSAFSFSSSLASIFVDSENEHYRTIDGDLYTIDGKTIVRYASAKTEENLIIPEGVEKIGGFAFSGANNILTVTIPASAAEVENGAFASCKSLTKITVASGNPVYTTYDGDLYKDNGKTFVQYACGKDGGYITVLPWVETIAPYAYYDADKITGVAITNGVRVIGDSAFYGCNGIIAVAMADSVNTIESSAFYGCSALKDILLGKGIKEVEDFAFYGFKNHLRVFYAGNKLEWALVDTGPLSFGIFYSDYTVIYYSETEPAFTLYGEYYWHYDEDGKMVIWQ